MSKMNFTDVLGKKLIIFDGGMGSMLQKQGLPSSKMGEEWNIEEPEKVLAVQKAYAEAGCDIINCNTFSANRYKLEKTQYGVAEVVKAAAGIARRAFEEGRPAELIEEKGDGWITLDMGSLGQMLEPFGDLEFDEAVEAFAEIVEAGKDLVDIICIETQMDVEEAKAAVTAAKAHSDLPIVVTFTVDKTGRTLMGNTLEDICEEICPMGVNAIGLNCGFGPEQMLEHLPVLKKHANVPVVITPNAGLPRMVDGNTVYDVEPEEFAVLMKRVVEGGAGLIGGCCGTTPDHMKAVCRELMN